MATNFPSSLDNFTNPVSGNTLDSPSHSLQHSDANDAIEAIEAKLGIGASPAGSATAGQVLTISAAGTSAWTTPTVPGLVHINTTTISSVSSQSINDVFSSTYLNYKILIKITPIGSTGTVLLKFRTSGSDSSTQYYYHIRRFNYANTTDVLFVAENNIEMPIATASSGSVPTFIVLDICNPNVAAPTIGSGQTTTGSLTTIGGFKHDVATAYDGFTLTFPSNSNGEVTIFGYRK